ncbi:fused MFS/spermidine synthase [Nanoarchaeota archaeon]
MKRGSTTNWIIFSIITLGIAEILTQLVLAREFLSVFYGNELVIGIVLANWLLISGIGSYVGRQVPRIADKQRMIILLHMLIAVILPIQLYIIRNLYNFAFTRGELVGVTQIFITAFLTLLPVCFITGFSLPLFSILYSKKKKPDQIGKVYFFDSLSNIIGGLLFSFILIYVFSPFRIALLVLIVNLAAAMFLSIRYRKTIFFFIATGILIISAAVFGSYDLNKLTTEQQYTGQDIFITYDSIYARYVVTETEGQLNFFENGMPLFSTNNVMENEEHVHYGMLQHSNPTRILLIGGGLSGTPSEILNHDVDMIDYVELDPILVKIDEKITMALLDEKVHVHSMDARRFVRQTPVNYDVILINMPDPGTAHLNRFYTDEFFADLKDILEDDGVVSLSISSGANYINEETRQLNSAVYNTLKRHFQNILLLPGDEAYMIASDAKLSYSNYRNTTIPTMYVNEDYMFERLDKGRISLLKEAVTSFSTTNTDFRPIAYYYHLLVWLKKFQADFMILIAAVIIILMFTLWRTTRTRFAVMTAGFAGISLELVIIMGFQVIYGYAYHELGIIITSFMVGLAIGAWITTKNPKICRNAISKTSMSIAAYALLLPLALYAMRDMDILPAAAAWLLFPALTIMIGLLVGALFPLAADKGFSTVSSTAGNMYFHDYIGACIGAVLTSVVIIPLLGIIGACIVVAALAILSGLLCRE